ncbi:O-antigen ligase [Anabaena sp. 4-3]|uniref:O-antigen ligase family protein n=1 Tax=Anabaena sp. 4-3 TaxID=1811979 RepID=UPI00082F669C|nr:O-antigen ligase family protein [Anabaena sp. 4-3]
MASDFINKLLNLIFSPYGFLGIALGMMLLEKAKTSRRLAWLLFSFCCYAASLAKFQDEWVKEPPALVFPLQQLRELGRPLTIVILALVLLLGMETKNGWRRVVIPQPINYLVMFQAAIFLKVLFYGDMLFALLAAMTFGAVVLMFKLGPSRWLQDESNFHLGVWSLAMSGVIFGLACTYQGIFNMYPMTFTQGRFLGTTGNPQHAAAFLASTVPCFIFLIGRNKKWDWVKAFWIAMLLIITYFLFLTGSRTGTLMAITSILFFYRNRSGTLLRLGFFAIVLLAIIFLFINPTEVINSNAQISYRLLEGGNTREGVWNAMWNSFINYPIFGAPLNGERVNFAENTWLAAGATTGIIGLIPLLMMGFGCLQMMFRLTKISKKNPNYFLHTSTVIAGLACLISGSFSEALLLGNMSFPVMALILYLSLGKYLIDADYKHQKDYSSSPTIKNHDFTKT